MLEWSTHREVVQYGAIDLVLPDSPGENTTLCKEYVSGVRTGKNGTRTVTV